MMFVLLGFLLAAIVFDVTFRRIPNSLVFCGIGLGLILAFLFFGSSGLIDSIEGMAIAGGVWLVLWISGMMGGGDQKLMMLVGVYLGRELSIEAVFIIAWCGGLQAIITVGQRKWKAPPGITWRNLLGEVRQPYSLAIAFGVVITIFLNWLHYLPRFF